MVSCQCYPMIAIAMVFVTVLGFDHSCFQILYVFRFLVMFFPLALSLTQVTCFCSQLHVITNHLPTVFSFQVQSQSLQNPHLTFQLKPRSLSQVFATIVSIALFIY